MLVKLSLPCIECQYGFLSSNIVYLFGLVWLGMIFVLYFRYTLILISILSVLLESGSYTIDVETYVAFCIREENAHCFGHRSQPCRA